MRIAVITLVAGRRRHLERQHAALAASTIAPDEYIVVSMGDESVATWAPSASPTPAIESVQVDGSALPLAAARNRGAARAIRDSADLLVFLDVDCLPVPALLERYRDAAVRRPDALLGGAVGYLPDQVDYDDPASFEASATFHSFRPRLPAGESAPADHRLFWSLSFAATRETWQRIGGFRESYRGYGAEDTDFGMTAQSAGVDFAWVGGAEAFHQHHATSDPPVQHLDDILANGAQFSRRWGFWPMEGWLQEFERLGLVERTPTGDWTRGKEPR